MMRAYQYIVADDERLIRTSLIKQVSAFKSNECLFAGEASDGLEALQIIEHSAVDIVFSDVRMPGMSGLELCEHIAHCYPWIKVVLISGYSDFEYVRKALHYGVSDYLLKPIRSDKLAQAIENAQSQLKLSEEKELAVLLALTEVDEKPLREIWKQYLLKRQPNAVIEGVLSVLSRRIQSLQKRPRLQQELLIAWSERFLQETGLFISLAPLQPEQVILVDQEWLDWKSTLGEWIVHLCSELHHRPTSTGTKTVSDVKHIIHKRFSENLTLEDLAAATYLNKTYLAGLFKQVTGLTIGQYIQEVRFKQACLLLETSRQKIHEIAETVGYHDLSHFSKTFKQHLGVTPQAYRNMVGASRLPGSTP